MVSDASLRVRQKCALVQMLIYSPPFYYLEGNGKTTYLTCSGFKYESASSAWEAV